jgi:hypothetical protein
MATKELSADDKFELLLQTVATALQQRNESIPADQLREILASTSTASATAMQKALKPENDTHPGISVFSHPEGDVKNPRPVLPFEFFYNAYPMHRFPETEHWRELELACLVRPGIFTCLRKDYSLMTVTVEGDYDAKGALTTVRVTFPVSRDEKALIPAKEVLLYQITHEGTPQQKYLRAMRDYLERVLGEDAMSA